MKTEHKQTTGPDSTSTETTDSQTTGPEINDVAIEVRVPGLLRDCTEQQARFTLHATTLAQAVERLLATYPRLRIHLYTEQGELRRHILLFYNQTNCKELESLDLPLQAGDRLSVVQAVSGGRA